MHFLVLLLCMFEVCTDYGLHDALIMDHMKR